MIGDPRRIKRNRGRDCHQPSRLRWRNSADDRHPAAQIAHLALMLNAGGDANFANRNGDAQLHLAVRIGWGDGLTMLLDAKANPNLANRRGETPLIMAVQGCNQAAVKLLLARGADPNRRDHVAGLSARDYAGRDNRVRDMARLIETARPTRK